MGGFFSPSFLASLCDPVERDPLAFDEARGLLQGAKSTYPLLSSRSPCLFAKPEATLGHFQAQWSLLRDRLDKEIDRAKEILDKKRLLPESAARIQKLRTARIQLKKELELIFASLVPHLATAKETAAKASGHQDAILSGLGVSVPLAQPLVAYPQNLFRDWVWGQEENSAYVNLVARMMDDHSPKKILVLAAGGGRLPYDLHEKFAPEFTVALDNSYFFSQCFDRICFGSGLALTEFPASALNDESRFQSQKIPKSSPRHPGLHYVLADLNMLPFNAGSFDLIITPWIIDLIPEKLPMLIHNISALLVPGGRWINFGSFMIDEKADLWHRWSRAEVLALMKEGGFSDVKDESPEVDYLKSPLSAYHRRERLWAFSGVRDATSREVFPVDLRPQWLKDFDLPIARDSVVEATEISHRVPSRVFQLIDGQRSFNAIAKEFAAEFEMTEQEAAGSLYQFLLRWAERR